MRKPLLLALLSTALLAPTAVAADANEFVISTEAQYRRLDLGSGALAVLTFPDKVQNVTTTREGIVEVETDGNRVIVAGLNNYGETPLMVRTEGSGLYTWRVVLGHAHAGRILNVSVTAPDPEMPTAVPAEPQPLIGEQLANTQAIPVPTEFVVQRVGTSESTSILLEIRAGDAPVTMNEQQVTVQAGGKSLRVQASPQPVKAVNIGDKGYGVVTVSGAHGPLTVKWPYREGDITKTFETTLN